MGQTGRIILGVDGGGSSCRAALVADGLRHEVTLGPANVSTDFDRAVATIREAILALAAKAGVGAGKVHAAAAHLGLAGVTGPVIAGRVAAALPLTDAVVTDDRPTTVAGALGSGKGSVAAIGTGSFLGRQADGGFRGIGGWGFEIGDQASGAWLGRRCLEEVMLSLDGIGAATALTQAILARFGDDPAAIVAHSMAARPADFAGLAPDILAAAGAGDPLGSRLMTEGAGYILKGLAALGWTQGEPLCLTGGLGPAYAAWIGQPVVPAQGSALDGALALATRRAGGATMTIAEYLDPGQWLNPAHGPLYVQLRKRIEAGIASGFLAPDMPLPPEREIATLTGLSRVTVRKAMAELAERGLILQRQGSGSFVAPARARVQQSLSRLTSFTEDMTGRGYRPGVVWLERGLFQPSEEEVAVLGLAPGAQVARLARLRRADDRPMAIERASLPPDILPNPLAVTHSLYEVLGQAGLRPVRAVQKISAVNLGQAEAGLLGVAPMAAGLRIERTAFLPDGRVVEYTRSIYRGDAYDFVAELRIPEN